MRITQRILRIIQRILQWIETRLANDTTNRLEILDRPDTELFEGPHGQEHLPKERKDEVGDIPDFSLDQNLESELQRILENKVFNGDLSDHSVAQLFNLIHLAKKNGVLTIESDRKIASVYFVAGKLAYAKLDKCDASVADILSKAGKISNRQAKVIDRHAKDKDEQELGLFLVNAGYVSMDEIKAHVREHILETTYLIFSWEVGVFRWVEDTKPPENVITVSADIREILIEGYHRMREYDFLRSEIPHLNFVFTRTDLPIEEIRKMQLTRDEWRIVLIIGPNNTLKKIADTIGFNEIEIRQIAHSLVQTGLFKLIEADAKRRFLVPPPFIKRSQNYFTKDLAKEFDEDKVRPIRVLIVDDIPDIRLNLKKAFSLEDGIDVVGEAANGFEGLWHYSELRPDVVCTNINMPYMDGITMTQKICERFSAQVLILSVVHDSQTINKALDAGARGYLVKAPDLDDLFDEIRRLHRRRISAVPKVLEENRIFYRVFREASGPILRKVRNFYDEKDSEMVILSPSNSNNLKIWPYELSGLRSLPFDVIEEADFNFTDFSDEDFSQASFLNTLQKLDLMCTAVGRSGKPFFSELFNIKELCLYGTEISGDALSAISGLNTLRTLDLSRTGINDESLEILQDLRLLECLILNRNSLTGKTFGILRRFPRLRQIRASHNPITSEGLEKIFDTLLELPEHVRLTLGGALQTPDDAKRIRDFNRRYGPRILIRNS